jgi:nucleotide-binding universal stress UspA family protein
MSPASPVVVVGIDGSRQSVEALNWAIHYAQCANGTVRAVAAWTRPAYFGYYGTFGTTMAYHEPAQPNLHEVSTNILTAVINEVAGDESGVAIEREVIEGHPATVLVDQSASADLLVVGARGHGTFTGLLLGSVSDHCVRHAACPVVVLRRRPTHT